MIRAVIFDMDGVLADTEWFYRMRRAGFLAEHGLSEEGFDFTGSNEKAIWEALVPNDPVRRKKLLLDYREYRKLHPAPYQKLADPVLRSLMSELKDRGLRIGIASSSEQEAIEALVQAAGIEKFIDCMVSGVNCTAHKPDPAIYLHTMARLGVTANEAIAVEDSTTGIAAAKSAGMKVYALAPRHGEQIDQSAATACIECLIDILKYLDD